MASDDELVDAVFLGERDDLAGRVADRGPGIDLYVVFVGEVSGLFERHQFALEVPEDARPNRLGLHALQELVEQPETPEDRWL